MTLASEVHPWVAARSDKITFALQVDTRSDDPAPGQSVLAAGRLAEALGFDAFFTGDHPSWQSEVWLHMAALAGTTDRIGLGPMVTSVLYRPPVLIARLAADLDHLSNGRLVLGLGIGWDAAALGWGTNEFDRIGLPFPPTRERQEALAEAIAIIRGVWGPEPFSFRGRHFRVKDAHVMPPPMQGVPPIVIAGAGERTLRQVAELADACNIGPVVTGGVDTVEQVRAKLDVLRRHCEAVGRPYEHILRSHFTIWLMLAEDEAGVRRKVDRYFPGGLDSIWRRCVVAGTPEQVVSYYQSYADAGMQYFIAQVLDARDEETFRLLAQKVMPRIGTANGRHKRSVGQRGRAASR
jgi:alkanesulfonate monooxygenase SsuD/methylene tetrahydromethanopterin reductase-like flavin-dependent oxidoreductase (luciferase family)